MKFDFIVAAFLISVILMVSPASAGDYKNSTSVNSSNNTFTISIDQIPDHYRGDIFTINGMTNLPLDENINAVVVSGEFTEANPGGPPFDTTMSEKIERVVPVISGIGENHTWSFEINTTKMKPESYIVRVESTQYNTIATALFHIMQGSVSPDMSTYGNWTEITSNATFEPRNYFGTGTFNDRLWVIGGREENFMNDVWSSPDGNTWNLETAHANFSPRGNMGITTFDNRIWVIGGAGENYRLMNDVWSSADGKNWELVTANASFDPRHSPGVVVFNNRLWVIGGNQNNDVWSSADGKNWELATANVSFGLRLGEGVAAFDNRLWVIGGNRNNDVWSSTDGKIWTLVNASAPFQQMEFTPVTVFDNKLWIVGGGSNGPTHETKNPSVFPAYEFNEIWSSADGKIWTLETEHAGFSPRYGHGLAVFRCGIWVIGGSNSSGNDVWYMPAKPDHVLPDNATVTPVIPTVESVSSTQSGIDPLMAGFTFLIAFGVVAYGMDRKY
jgi:hypothetical protein